MNVKKDVKIGQSAAKHLLMIKLYLPFKKEGDIMEKNIILNNLKTDFWLEDTGRLRNAKTQRWLKGGINKGYHFYSLYFKGKQYTLYTHRLVAEYFIENLNPEKTIVHHLDGNKLNNNYLNLEWVSPKEHNDTINQLNQRNAARPKRKNIINIEDYGEIAQFRSTPYYATKKGKILNMEKRIELNLSPSGNYLRFNAAYGLNKKFLVHRVVWECFKGEIPKDMDIDHIDGNPKNNCLNNLQILNRSDNLKKRKIDYSYAVNNFNH